MRKEHKQARRRPLRTACVLKQQSKTAFKSKTGAATDWNEKKEEPVYARNKNLEAEAYGFRAPVDRAPNSRKTNWVPEAEFSRIYKSPESTRSIKALTFWWGYAGLYSRYAQATARRSKNTYIYTCRAPLLSQLRGGPEEGSICQKMFFFENWTERFARGARVRQTAPFCDDRFNLIDVDSTFSFGDEISMLTGIHENISMLGCIIRLCAKAGVNCRAKKKVEFPGLHLGAAVAVCGCMPVFFVSLFCYEQYPCILKARGHEKPAKQCRQLELTRASCELIPSATFSHGFQGQECCALSGRPTWIEPACKELLKCSSQEPELRC